MGRASQGLIVFSAPLLLLSLALQTLPVLLSFLSSIDIFQPSSDLAPHDLLLLTPMLPSFYVRPISIFILSSLLKSVRISSFV